MEKRKRRREIEVTKRRRTAINRVREIYPVINSLCALHSLKHSKSFTELHKEEKREEGARGDQEQKRSQKGRDKSRQ